MIKLIIFLFYIHIIKKNNLKLESILHSTNEVPGFQYQGVDFSFSEKFNLNFSLTKKINYLFWSFNVIILCLFDLFRGRWWNPLMLSQAADRKIVELLNNECIHELYLFNNTSGFAYRPMWTYESENKGSKTVLYFYSLNYCPLTKKLNKPIGLSISNWKYISVWGNAHAAQLKSQIKNSFEVFSYEPIFLDTGYEELQNINHKFVTIFDVTPLRPLYRKCNYFSSEYYATKNVIKFIEDIIFLSKKHNIKTILKIKRISSHTDKNYLTYLNNKIIQNELIVIQENISTFSLIKNSKLIISYPLTSIAKLSDMLCVKNIFYSPINIKIDKKLLLESKILYSEDQLDNLFSKVFI